MRDTPMLEGGKEVEVPRYDRYGYTGKIGE